MKKTLILAVMIYGTLAAGTSLAAGICKLCADPGLTGQCTTMQEGATLDLSTVSLKDRISSLRLSDGMSLQYWGWNQDPIHARGIIYRTTGGYESTDGRNLSPESLLNTNDDFDFVRCGDFSRWEAVLYVDPNRSGGRFYLSPSTIEQSLAPIDMVARVSSVHLRPGTTLYYFYTFGTSQYGWIQRDYNNQYSSSRGGGDNAPESWLQTNDLFAQVVADKTMPVFIQRHGVTTNGTDITSAGRTALETAWNTVDCRLINDKPSILYLSSAADPAGTERYVQTSQIIKQALETHCASTSATLIPIPVQALSTFNAAQATAVMDQIKDPAGSRTRIFVLGSALLHKLTQASDCASAPCYLQQWPAFMTLWNASHSLQHCQVGPDQGIYDYNEERQYMYNNLYRVQRFIAGGTQNPVCMSSVRVSVDAYTPSSCGAAQASVVAANTCPL